MKTEKMNDRYDENQTNRDGNWHVSADELQFYAETGFLPMMMTGMISWRYIAKALITHAQRIPIL